VFTVVFWGSDCALTAGGVAVFAASVLDASNFVTGFEILAGSVGFFGRTLALAVGGQTHTHMTHKE
jgi:hypothetical protein